MPLSMKCAQENLKVRPQTAGFVIPLGTQLNMDGTALYEAAAALFIANLIGMDLSLTQQLIVCLTAMIASLGAPGIPSAGMVTMIMVLQSVGLPAEAIAILLPIDRILDTVRTVVNVQGDMMISVVVDRYAKQAEPQSTELSNEKADLKICFLSIWFYAAACKARLAAGERFKYATASSVLPSFTGSYHGIK